MSFAIFFLGLIAGSFLNVVISRLPQNESFIGGRSRCQSCKQTIAWYDLIPLMSFLLLQRKCRKCKNRISLRYPFVEFVSGLFFVFLWDRLFFLLALELLLALAVIDVERFIIPDSLLVALGVLGFGYHIFHNAITSVYIATAVLSAAFFFFLWYFSRGAWIGFGDVKLAGALGLLFGFPGTIVALYLAALSGGFFGIFLLLLKKATMKTRLPFGAFLSFGAGLWVFFQKPLYDIISRFYSY